MPRLLLVTECFNLVLGRIVFVCDFVTFITVGNNAKPPRQKADLGYHSTSRAVYGLRIDLIFDRLWARSGVQLNCEEHHRVGIGDLCMPSCTAFH